MVLANNNNEQGDTYCNSNNNDNIDYLTVVSRGINSGVSNIISGVNSSKSIVVTVVIH